MLIGWGYGRAPPDLNSRACFRIQLTYLVGGLWSSASGPYQSSPVGPLPVVDHKGEERRGEDL